MKTNYTLIGDVREKLKELPDKSIQMCVTSPPYYALRDYGTAEWEGGNPNCSHMRTTKISKDTSTGHKAMSEKGHAVGDAIYKKTCKKCGAKRKDNQLGLENTPEEFIQNMVEVFAEVYRVLRDDGTLWLNLGDSYAMSSMRGKNSKFKSIDQSHSGITNVKRSLNGLPPKSLMGIPWKVAIALQEWGWILRQDIIWAKKNCMPESVKDRFTKSHEYIFLLSKQPKYFFNQVLEESVSEIKKRTRKKGEGQDSKIGTKGSAGNSGKRNKRSVWNMRTASYKEAHFAVFPPELAETCIKAGCPEKICSECETPYIKVMERKKSIHSDKSESARFSVNLKNNHRKLGEKYSKQMKENPLIDKGLQKQCDCETNETKSGIVLDCFMGSGTTAMVAQDLFRKWIGVELNPEYEKLIRKRTAQQVLF
jgi:DNA modification methylase